MKNILVLFASPHKKGNTAALLDVYLNKYTKNLDNGFKIDILSIYDLHILPCIGCDMCINGDVCSQNRKDDAKKIFDYILRSNHIIVASPVYFSGFPAPLKALIDRAQRFYNKKIQTGKIINLKVRTGALIATSGSKNESSFIQLESCCKQFFDCIDIYFSSKLCASGTDNLNNINVTEKEC